MYSLHLARTHTTSSDRQTSPDVGVANSQEKTTRTPYSQDTTRERRLLMSCASHLQHCHNVSKKGNMCDEEIDQQLSPRLYHRALDVSLFLSPLNEETDITSTRKINTADSCACHLREDSYIVDLVHGFDIIRHVHSSRKDGSSSRTSEQLITEL